MFFVLSKTLSYITLPFVIITVCFIVSVLLKNAKWKKRLFWIGFSLLIFFSNDFIANEVMSAWELKTKPFASMHPYEWGIVLTGTTLSGIEPDDRVYFSRGADRVYHTVQLYKLGLVKKILVSGGTGRLVGEEDPEALKVEEAMIVMGVPDSVILTESETRNTYESAVEVKKMLVKLDIKDKDCLLITSAFHMRRSLACYRKAGLDVDNFTTDFYAHPRVFYPDGLFFPKIEAMLVWHKLAKEWVGFAAYKAAGYI